MVWWRWLVIVKKVGVIISGFFIFFFRNVEVFFSSRIC